MEAREMTFIDVSLGIGHGLFSWPGDPPIEIERVVDMSKGDAANVSQLRIGSHTGTHVDPPVHFIPGAAGVDAISLDVLCGPAVLADLRGLPGPIGPKELDALDVPPGTTRLLIRTDNSEYWAERVREFPKQYVALSAPGAHWVVERGIKVFGTDFLSVEEFKNPGHPTHVALLEAGVVIVEGLDFSKAEPGAYDFYCFPLKIVDGDGAPARAALVKR